MLYWKFVTWEPAPLEKVLSEGLPAALTAYDNGNEKPFMDRAIATTEPFCKIGGWCFDLRPYLRRYWVKTKYCGIVEYWAVNKTAIRKELKSDCLEIVAL